MVRNRRGHDLRVKAIINHGKQLGRSFLMLVHFITVFVCFVSHSVNCFVGVLKWTSMFARYTVALFESIHRRLDWWTTRRRRGAMKKMVSSSDTDSEWRRRLRCYGFKEDVPGKQSTKSRVHKKMTNILHPYDPSMTFLTKLQNTVVENLWIQWFWFITVLCFWSFKRARIKPWWLKVLFWVKTVAFPTTPVFQVQQSIVLDVLTVLITCKLYLVLPHNQAFIQGNTCLTIEHSTNSV